MEANGARKELRYEDEHLARAVCAGDDEAFEILFQRHQPAILAFCRHMLGRPHDAQDAAQHTFLTAYRVLRAGDAPAALRSWLFAVARNRCISMLRARREQAGDDRLMEVTTDGLAGQVQDRADLRALLSDVADLPDDQRAALLLAEIGDVSHQEIAGVIGVRREKVKALVFQARRALMAARDARDTPCMAIQQELATARGAALRRAHLRRHLHVCPSCREFREELRLQRDALALILPVAPAFLRDSILGGAGGHAAAAGANGAAAGGHGANAGVAGANGATAGGHGAAAGANAVAAGTNTAAVGANAATVGAAAVLKATAVKVGIGVVAAGGIAAGGTAGGIPWAGDTDPAAAARNAPVTVAASPRTSSPPRWAPTSGMRPPAGRGAGEPIGPAGLGRAESNGGGAPAGPGTGRRDRAERGAVGPSEHARSNGRGPGQAERGPKPKDDERAGGRGTDPNSAGGRGKAIDHGAKSKPARGHGPKSKAPGKGPKPKRAGNPGANGKATGRGAKPRNGGGAATKSKPAGNGQKPKSAGGNGSTDAKAKPVGGGGGNPAGDAQTPATRPRWRPENRPSDGDAVKPTKPAPTAEQATPDAEGSGNESSPQDPAAVEPRDERTPQERRR